MCFNVTVDVSCSRTWHCNVSRDTMVVVQTSFRSFSNIRRLASDQRVSMQTYNSAHRHSPSCPYSLEDQRSRADSIANPPARQTGRWTDELKIGMAMMGHSFLPTRTRVSFSHSTPQHCMLVSVLDFLHGTLHNQHVSCGSDRQWREKGCHVLFHVISCAVVPVLFFVFLPLDVARVWPLSRQHCHIIIRMSISKTSVVQGITASSPLPEHPFSFPRQSTPVVLCTSWLSIILSC